MRSGIGAVAFVLLFTCTAPLSAAELTVSDAWIRPTPPNAPVAGGYITIANGGAKSDRLLAVRAEFAGRTQIHEMRMAGDVMQMRPVEGGLDLPPGETVKLEPGGLHVMFMNLREPMKPGEIRPVELRFEQAGEMSVEFVVGRPD